MNCRQFARPRRRGYLLLTVVVLIAVATLLLSRVASTSMRVASIAIEEERELRHRWAINSLKRYSLDHAGDIFGSNTPSTDDTIVQNVRRPTVWQEIELAGQQWRVILGDESAKLDVSRVSLRYGERKAKVAINEMVAGEADVRAARDLASVGQSSVGRWENWLNDDQGRPMNEPRLIAAATKNLTLWGNGRLNIRRCEPKALDTLWRVLFNRPAPTALVENQNSAFAQTPSQLVSSLGLRESQANQAREWLTTVGNCYSVWVFCESDRRVPAAFFVEWGSAGSAKIYRAYEY